MVVVQHAVAVEESSVVEAREEQIEQAAIEQAARSRRSRRRSKAHPSWKRVMHTVTGEEKWVRWWDVACRYGRDCAHENCRFRHDSESAQWEVVALCSET